MKYEPNKYYVVTKVKDESFNNFCGKVFKTELWSPWKELFFKPIFRQKNIKTLDIFVENSLIFNNLVFKKIEILDILFK